MWCVLSFVLGFISGVVGVLFFMETQSLLPQYSQYDLADLEADADDDCV
jgi:hypothetical protein